MNHQNQLSADEARLEQLAKEDYGVMSTPLNHYLDFASLVALKRFIRNLRRNGGQFFLPNGQLIPSSMFPFLIDLVIRNCSPLGRTSITDQTILGLMDKYINFHDMLQLTSGQANLNKYVPEWLVRTAFEQLPTQESTLTLLPRVLFLYDIIPNKDSQKHQSFIKARDLALRTQFRVSLEELLLCTFALGAMSDKTDSFKVPITTEVDWIREYLNSDALNIVLLQLSLTRDEYKTRANEEFSGLYRYIKNEPSLITTCPIIRYTIRNEEHFVVPFSNLLLTGTIKLLHKSFRQFFEHNGTLQEFMSSFGHVFKDYIGCLLKECYGEGIVFDLDKLNAEGSKIADWAIILDDEVALFECKGTGYPNELKKTGKLEKLEEFANGQLRQSAEQLTSTEDNWGKLSAQLGKGTNADTWHKFIVLEEHFQFANRIIEFLPNNSSIQNLYSKQIQIISALEIELVTASNHFRDFNATYGAELDRETQKFALEDRIRKLPGFSFRKDNIIEKTLNEFLHVHELGNFD